MSRNNRTILAVVFLVAAIITVIDPVVSLRFLGAIQSLVIITLGITAILFLWKRM